jgi:putative FmdB family regulatory protein
MPLFDFKCDHCETFKADVILRVKETDDKSVYPVCDKCSQPMEKLIGNPGRAIFHGRGFHATDYRAPTRGR